MLPGNLGIGFPLKPFRKLGTSVRTHSVSSDRNLTHTSLRKKYNFQISRWRDK